MLKLTLSIAILLFGSGTNALSSKSQAEVKDHGEYVYLGNQTIYTVTTVTFEQVESVISYWQNRTDGEHCIDLFQQYYTLSSELNVLVEHAEEIIDQYNHDCSDLCFPGYSVCNATGTCLLPEDCCTATYPGYEWCLSGTPGYAVCVPDCCVEDEEVWCNGECTPIDDLIGNDYLPVEGDTPYDSDTCCYEDECCTEENTEWLTRLQTCCIPGTSFIYNGVEEYCCPEKYCEELIANYLPLVYVITNFTDRCQPYENVHCCAPGYEWCAGEGCVADVFECCPEDQNHCPTQDNECRYPGQCCDEGYYWCEAD